VAKTKKITKTSKAKKVVTLSVKKQPVKKASFKVKKTPVAKSNATFFDRMQTDLRGPQSPAGFAVGALVVTFIAVFIFNFFNQRINPNMATPETDSQATQSQDVAKDSLPGKYTVKDGDTLFTIAKNYYDDGYKYQAIASANNLTDVNNITPGQVLEIPKQPVDTTAAMTPAPTPSATDLAMSSSSSSSSDSMTMTPANTQYVQGGQGGSTDQTEWGTKITSDTYVVVQGDWLSKIAGRAYGDIYSYDKIAKANHISDPNEIEPGMVLQIPR